MHHDALIAAFRQLQTNDERLNAIRALALELTSHEWRQLQDLAAARNFQTDIVGQLPVELVAHIFAHLDTSTAFWLQSVSRRWRRVLQSPQVLTNTLVPWYGYTPQLLRADYAMCKTKAEVIHAFRNACPKHHFKIRIVGIHHRIILTEDTLILTAGAQGNSDPRILCFFNIKTWELHSMTGDARERISQTFASDQIAGFTTESRVCYVSDLEGRGKRNFRVPNNAFFQSVACRGRTVACAGCLPDHAEVYVWDYDTQQGKTFSIDFNSHLFPFPRVWRNHKHGMALLVQPEIERIIVFTDERCSGGNDFDEAYCQRDEGICTIRYAQFTYDGECVSESESLIDEVAPRQQATFQNNNNYFIPVNSRGTFKISIGSFNYAPATRWIQFDEEANTFTQPVPTTENGQMWASRSLFWWKDTVYSSMKATEQMHSPAPSYLTYLGTSDRLRYKPLLLHTRSPEDNVDLVNTRDCVVLNEKYIVRALPHGFHVLCFEDSAQYPKENGAFFDRGYVEVHNVQSSTGLP